MSPDFGKLFPEDVIVEQGLISSSKLSILKEQVACLGSVSKMRIQEFAFGRKLARRALLQFGVLDAVIGVGSIGQPIWPEGFTGSISHKDQYCAVAVARRSCFTGIGIDIERNEPFEQAELDLVSTSAERKQAPLLSMESCVFVNLLFSGKEAFFKSQYAVTGIADVEFLDVDLLFDPKTQQFTVNVVGSKLRKFLPRNGGFEGRFLVFENIVASGVVFRS